MEWWIFRDHSKKFYKKQHQNYLTLQVRSASAGIEVKG